MAGPLLYALRFGIMLIDDGPWDVCGQTVCWQISARPSPEATVHGEPGTEQRARRAHNPELPAPGVHLGRRDLGDGPGRPVPLLLSRFLAGLRVGTGRAGGRHGKRPRPPRRCGGAARGPLGASIAGAGDDELPLPLPGRVVPLGRNDVTALPDRAARPGGKHDTRHHRTPKAHRRPGATGQH